MACYYWTIFDIGRDLVKMKKFLVSTFLLIFTIFLVQPINSHAQFADGTYDVKYQVNKPGSISASMANDYFLKPAKLIVKDGKMAIQLTIKNSTWVTEFNPPGGASIVSRNDGADSRVMKFNVSSVTSPLTVAMKIDIDEIDYHHGYKVDFVFDASNVPAKTAEKTTTTTSTSKETSNNTNATSSNSGSSNAGKSSTSSTNVETSNDSVAASSTTVAEEGETEQVVNPQTSDAIPYVFIIALVASAFLFIRTKQIN